VTNWPPRRKPTIPVRFAERFRTLFKAGSEIGRQLDDALGGIIDSSQAIPAGFKNTTPPAIVAGSAGTAGTESAGWMAADARPAVTTATPTWPTQKIAAEGSGFALMRSDAKIAQGIVTRKGDLLTHDGVTAEALPVGADDTTLLADSTQTTGLRWGSPAESANLVIGLEALLPHPPRIPKVQAGAGISIVENALGPVLTAAVTSADSDQNILATQVFGG
jgi:hypothetical protein